MGIFKKCRAFYWLYFCLHFCQLFNFFIGARSTHLKINRMTRVCCINNCKNASSKEIKKSENTVFKFPSSPDMRKKWLEVLGNSKRIIKNRKNEAISDLYICDLHFKESDFLKDATSNFVDGKEVTVSRKRIRLKASSVPSVKINPVTSSLNTCNSNKISFITTKDIYNDDNAPKILESLPETYVVEHDYGLHDYPGPIFCTNAIINIDPESLELPKTWGVTEKIVQNKKYLLFMKVITQAMDQQETELLQKYMLLDCTGKNASYFVYGHQVKDMALLPEFIHNTDTLLRSLKIFEVMNVCEGLGRIDPSLIRKSKVLRDSANYLRHASCTWLLTRNKTCIFCKKLKRLISRRRLRSNKVACGGSDSKEMLNNLRRQLAREKRLRKIAVEQKRMLLKEVSEKRKEIATAVNYGVSFENICFQHRVLHNHRLALKEILDTSKTKPQGRRYSEEWLMFCISISIRSPSIYEFLRKTNIIPLPNLATIRRYFYEN
ncbi:uncharacterized protein LOC108736120 isoform X1 [Agrilus planipennis]|uniref:Uncharacterized protein LOC108736120 isoform X1 n=1 Tax=Agrilus planipennis TaxID=224129 RepID=A0A1W4WUV3_AGRPL|nr:uncharacterized protein LOC108736120 isoform X1 [Agrilus planipennis]